MSSWLLLRKTVPLGFIPGFPKIMLRSLLPLTLLGLLFSLASGLHRDLVLQEKSRNRRTPRVASETYLIWGTFVREELLVI